MAEFMPPERREPVEKPPVSRPPEQNKWVLYFAIGAVVLGLLLLSVIVFYLVFGGEDDGVVDNPTPTATVATGVFTGTRDVVPFFPTPSVAAVTFNVQTFGQPEPISVTLDIPITLDVEGTRFQLETDVVSSEGVWQPDLPIGGEQTAAWVYGTVINYVVGLPDNVENRALLDALAPGDTLRILGRNGSVNEFAFDRREVVDADNRDMFLQGTPGVTLFLVGTADTKRLLVHGRYVVPDTSGSTVNRNQVELGEVAQIDNWQVVAEGTTLLLDRPEAPTGFAYFLIDYSLTNVGQTMLDMSTLVTGLTDQYGNQYVLNPLAVQLGNYPLAQGVVAPGQTMQATAGYQIPGNLNNGTLTWVVQVSGNAGRLDVSLPFGSEEDPAQNAIVSLGVAQVSADGTSLLLQGQLTNLSDRPLIVQEQDLRLVGGSTVYLLFSTTPGFPWVVGAGQTIPFGVQFQRPLEPDAVFTLLNYPFALNGLR